MRSYLLKMSMILLLCFGFQQMSFAKNKKDRPPKPEPVEEVIPPPPGRFYTWEPGRWKWKKKQQNWIWIEGRWEYAYNNNFNRWGWGNPFFSPYRFYRPRLFYRGGLIYVY